MAVEVRKALQAIPKYISARSLRSLQDELGVERIIKLAANENNLGCSPLVAQRLQEQSGEFSRYPDYTNTELLLRLTKKHGVKDSELIFTDGSFELISLIAQTYLEEGDESIVAEPSFGWYRNVTYQAGAKVVAVPVKGDVTDLDDFLAAITPKTKIIWFCNPNNPLGSMVEHDAVYDFIQKVPSNILIVLDEAYIDFSTEGQKVDSISIIHSFDNVISLRTFSKLYGLASMRLGYGIANESIIGSLFAVKQPFNVTMAAQIAAAASLDDEEFPKKVLANNQAGLQLYYNTLDELGLKYVRSHGNFILFDTGIDSDITVDFFLKKGVLLRGGREFGRPTWLRVTIGTQEENELVLGYLKELLQEQKG